MTHTTKKLPAKRVDIVSLKMVKEGSILYENRRITSPGAAAELVREFLEDSDREKFVVVRLFGANAHRAKRV